MSPRQPSALLRIVTIAAVALGLGAALVSSARQGWTNDEPIHLEWSRRLLEERVTERQSALHFNSKTPVTMANVAARKLAKRLLDVRDAGRLRFAARLPTACAFAALLAAAFLIARAWLGGVAACLATTGVALDPDLIAHASLATVDVLFALATLLTVAAAVRFARGPSLARAALLGLALGLAFSTKFTAFLLVPGVALAAFALDRRPVPSWRGAARLAGHVVLAAAVAAGVVCAAYLWVDVGTPLGGIRWRSAPMVLLASALPSLRLPLPADFLTGFDICLASEREKNWNVVLLGRWHPDGVWYYFPLLWLMKTPVLLLLAQVYGLWRALSTRVLWSTPALRVALLDVAAFLFYFCFLFRAEIGFRYVLMCVPLVYVMAASGLASLAGNLLVRVAGVVAVLAAVGENAAYLGNHLAFTNAAVQPKRHVFRWIGDSNVDWGQNDDRIDDYLARAPFDPTHVNPVHVLPGHDLLNVSLASGAVLYPRHRWVRENLEPIALFDDTHVLFDLDPATFERFLTAARRRSPTDVSRTLCSGGEGFRPLAGHEPVSFPDTEGRKATWLVCVATSEGADLVLRGAAGRILLGGAESPLKEWEAIGAGQSAWHRLDPGLHAFRVGSPRSFQGQWSVPRGALSLRVTPAALGRDGLREVE